MDSLSRLIRLELAEVLRTEARFDGPGTAAIVAALLDALLGMALRSRPDQRLGTPAYHSESSFAEAFRAALGTSPSTHRKTATSGPPTTS